MNGSWFLSVAFFGWIPIVLLLFPRTKSSTSMIGVFVLGWLLLPVTTYRIPGIPVFTKIGDVTLSALLAMLIFDSARLAKFRSSPLDLPMLVWCVSPSISVLVNGLGPGEAFLRIVDQVLMWGGPYLIGRLYFGTRDGARALCVGIVLGGLLYVPLCLYEMRMSPQLHSMLYGYHQHVFLQSVREGGYRPTVFLQHGLAVALWMSCAAIVGVWLWRRRVVARLFGVNFAWIAGSVTIVAALCKSFGALCLLVLGLLVMASARALNSRAVILALALVAPTYIALRAPGIWNGESMVQFASSINADRGASLGTRVHSENRFGARAMQQPLLGWGGWGRNMEIGERDVTAEGAGIAMFVDGFWIIVFGKFGLLGIASMTAALIVPVVAVVRRAPKAFLFGASGAPALSMCLIVILFQIDCLFNAMDNPMYVLAAGGLAGLAQGGFDTRSARKASEQSRLRRPGGGAVSAVEEFEVGREFGIRNFILAGGMPGRTNSVSGDRLRWDRRK